MTSRGMLTDEIKSKSKELFGYEINTRELRLIPYIIYVMTNERYINIKKVNAEELTIIHKWMLVGHIYGTLDNLYITKKFWDICNEILYFSYVIEK